MRNSSRSAEHGPDPLALSAELAVSRLHHRRNCLHSKEAEMSLEEQRALILVVLNEQSHHHLKTRPARAVAVGASLTLMTGSPDH